MQEKKGKGKEKSRKGRKWRRRKEKKEKGKEERKGEKLCKIRIGYIFVMINVSPGLPA